MPIPVTTTRLNLSLLSLIKNVRSARKGGLIMDYLLS